MMFSRGVSRSLNGGLSHQRLYLSSIRSMSISSGGASNFSESADDFTERVFGSFWGRSPTNESFFQDLGDREKALSRNRFEPEIGRNGEGSESQNRDGLDDTFSTLNDGMDGKLKKAATFFEINPDEIKSEDYVYRSDMVFRPEDTYEPKDLDITKPGVYKPAKRLGFEVTTKEVLNKADFRNVRFLANFITEAGIIIKRSQTKISAKAQRKIAREIKTARAFGLMPFTTMGQYPFIAGNSREDLGEEEEFESFVPGLRFVESDPISDQEIIPDSDNRL
ncbi:hypothetical protein AQUCO_04500099v1 [Aquilegia coerulea]|uniref:Small ribosomal subunit protein bS18c n=2 Tax=Aquilegia coerulea TaxID=218851 RepID=A0A2G5CM60_AQUCA|nr:hypothetical protein AQUCO_04500099v1 [Aquilegia coerulea]